MKFLAFAWERQGRSLLLTARIPVKSKVVGFGPCWEALFDSNSPHTALGEIATTRSGLGEVLMPTACLAVQVGVLCTGSPEPGLQE